MRTAILVLLMFGVTACGGSRALAPTNADPRWSEDSRPLAVVLNQVTKASGTRYVIDDPRNLHLQILFPNEDFPAGGTVDERTFIDYIKRSYRLREIPAKQGVVRLVPEGDAAFYERYSGGPTLRL